MRLRALLLLTLLCACAWVGAAEPLADDVDADVIRKVKKLLKATLSSEDAEREKGWEELRNMGNLAVPGLLAVYRKGNPTLEEMRSLLIALGDSKDPRTGPALVELLDSKEPMVRRDAARALGDSSYKAGGERLLKIATDEKEDEEVRLFAAAAAGKLGQAGGFDVLKKLLDSPRPEIRSRAVFALGKFGGPAQIAILEKALEDKEASVREDAVEALRLTKVEAAWGPLIKSTSDADYKIRNAAMEALMELTKHRPNPNTPQAWQEWWKKRADKSAAPDEKKNDAKDNSEKKPDDAEPKKEM